MLTCTEIEGKKYPAIILGEDHFTGWFSKSRYKNSSDNKKVKSYKETIKIAYSLGVRGFTMSPHDSLIKVLKEFKEKHPDIVCISNPHFGKNYYLEKESLWSTKNWNRLTATIHKRLGKLKLEELTWFKNADIYKPFSNKEIDSFWLNANEYGKSLNIFGKFCDFSLIGNLHRSALLLLGRKDLIKKESELVRDYKMIPLLFCEAGVATLEKAKGIDCAGYWICMSEDFAYPSISKLTDYLKRVKKPVTAYKAFTRKEGFNVRKTVNFFSNIKQVKSLVVGIENASQAKDTFVSLREVGALMDR